MTVLYLQCSMGASGDMLTAALAGLLPDPQRFADTVSCMGLDGVSFSLKKAVSKGMAGLHAEVRINGKEEDEVLGTPHSHEHGAHSHEHHHSHASLSSVHAIIDGLAVPDEVKTEAKAVYDRIAEAEAKAHGTVPGSVHFHEVGTKDAIADVVSVCLLMKMLSPSEVVVSPVCVGRGLTYTAHGFLPVPAPATAALLEGVPAYGSRFDGELCTPTGAALLAHFADRFGEMPAMVPEKTSCGIGTREFPEANCLRAVIGKEFSQPESGQNTEAVLELEANIDDMTPEDLAFARDTLLAAGALDAWITPIAMKKGRAACMLSALIHPEEEKKFSELFFLHTTTLGVRFAEKHRRTLFRKEEIRQTPFGLIRVKSAEGYGLKREKPEFDDLAEAARKNGVSIREIRASLKNS